METTITKLADFIAGVSFGDLPPDVAAATKWMLLDSLGCTVAGVESDKGKWGMSFVRRFFPSPPQATVLGFGDKLSAFGAAFANGEMMNGLDYEPSNKHLPPYVIPACLAVAEMNRCSGKELIAAIAAAHEAGDRIGGVLGDFRALKEDGKHGLPPVTGYGFSIFAGAAGAAKLAGLPAAGTAHAMGLAGVMAAVNSQTAMHKDVPTTSAKYMLAGAGCQSALSAVYLAEAGHRGDLSVLDGEYGFWRFSGAARWDAEAVLHDLGKEWRFSRGIPIKRYPCCRIMHGGLDCLCAIIEEQHLRPEEIEGIHAYLEPTCIEPIFHNKNIDSQTDAQFSIAYNMALVAHGLKPGVKWQTEECMKNPAILRLMEKITCSPHPAFSEALKKNPDARMSGVDVSARGKVYSAESTFIKGTYGGEHGMSDGELVAKFKENASAALPPKKVDEACEMLLDLESICDISELIEVLHV